MPTIKKMIINRNDLEFIYAEKQKDMIGNINYLVYHQNTKPIIYSKEIFHSIYGEDKKYPLITFISSVEDRLLELDIDNDKKLLDVYNNFLSYTYEKTFFHLYEKYNRLLTIRIGG